jgi:hypothetical protein
MARKSKKSNVVALFPQKQPTAFHIADVLYATCWSSLAPGVDGWRVVVPDDDQVTRVAVIPPGAEQPAFVVTREGHEAVVTRTTPAAGSATSTLGRFESLRHALLALCPLDPDKLEDLNTRMEVIYPRSLREAGLRVVGGRNA